MKKTLVDMTLKELDLCALILRKVCKQDDDIDLDPTERDIVFRVSERLLSHAGFLSALKKE